MMNQDNSPNPSGQLQRHFGLLQATALNVTMIVGAGVFVVIPSMLEKLPGPYALLGWVGAGVLILIDGLIWSELGATLPGSGGSYLYLLESFGREKWGRALAFLFIWQFMISGPLELASGLIAMGQFASAVHPSVAEFCQTHTQSWNLFSFQEKPIAVSFGPVQIGVVSVGIFLLFLLNRRITSLGRLTVTFWVGVLVVIVWILVEGGRRFQSAVAFDFAGILPLAPKDFAWGLGGAMILAMYSYLGYYHICYIGDEVREPGRTIPRAILLSALIVTFLFIGLHLAMLGTVSWHEVEEGVKNNPGYTLPVEFVRRIYGSWGYLAAAMVSLFLVWSCMGSVFAGLLGYSRIPFGAARYGHFFAALAKVHPVHNFPHVSLLLVGALTLFWAFFSLDTVIFALITTRIIEQFIGQIIGVMLLRKSQPDRPRPFKIWLYPLPCFLALAGWTFLYVAAGLPFILLGLGTLAFGLVVFLIWSWKTRTWPFTIPPS